MSDVAELRQLARLAWRALVSDLLGVQPGTAINPQSPDAVQKSASPLRGKMKLIRRVLLLILLAFSATLWAEPKKYEILGGCQGEGCDCFRAYGEAKVHDFDIPTIRPFTLYASANEKSKLLGKFTAGTMARPKKQVILVLDAGDYLLEENLGNLPGLMAGEHVDTLISQGEGAMRMRKNGAWIDYDGDELTLKKIRATKLQEWMEISVGQMSGYSKDYPFENCLE